MRYPASEKAEIIQLVEQSHLPAKRTLGKLGIPPATFYRWYDRYREGGPEALDDRRSRPDRVWNRIPDDDQGQSGLYLLAASISPFDSSETLMTKFAASHCDSIFRIIVRFDQTRGPTFFRRVLCNKDSGTDELSK